MISEGSEAVLKVERHRVVDLGADAGRFEPRPHVVAARNADRVLIEDVLAIGRPRGKANGLGQPRIREQSSIALRVPPAHRAPLRQVRQLDPQHRGLNRIEPEVAANPLVEVLRLGAMVAEQPDFVRQPIVVRAHRRDSLPQTIGRRGQAGQ